MTPRFAWLAAAVVAAGCGDMPERTQMIVGDPKADLQTLAVARVYFGHQSVGNDVVKGLAELATAEGVPLRIVEVPEGVDDELPGIVHARLGRNREPETKCDAFGQFLTRQVDDRKWDAAVLKFCYADLGDGGENDPSRLIVLQTNGRLHTSGSTGPGSCSRHGTAAVRRAGKTRCSQEVVRFRHIQR